MRFLVSFVALAVLADGYIINQTPSIRTPHQNRRWFSSNAPAAPAICPPILPDFSFLTANKDFCYRDLIFDAFFVHNTTGDFALVPTVYKSKQFSMHHPLGVNIDPHCSGIDEEVFCAFANKSSFSGAGETINLTPQVVLVKDSCNRQVVAQCKSTWEAAGALPKVQTCPKVLHDYPPLEDGKFLCDHEYIIESLFVHNATGEFALVHANHKAVRALLKPATALPIQVPETCKPVIDEELFCVFANSRDFSTGNSSGTLLISNTITMIKKACNMALINKCFTGNWDFARRGQVQQQQQGRVRHI